VSLPLSKSYCCSVFGRVQLQLGVVTKTRSDLLVLKWAVHADMCLALQTMLLLEIRSHARAAQSCHTNSSALFTQRLSPLAPAGSATCWTTVCMLMLLAAVRHHKLQQSLLMHKCQRDQLSCHSVKSCRRRHAVRSTISGCCIHQTTQDLCPTAGYKQTLHTR
jgi:hypothetical protein